MKEASSAEMSETCIQTVHLHSFENLSRHFEVVSCLGTYEIHIYALDDPVRQTSVGSVRKSLDSPQTRCYTIPEKIKTQNIFLSETAPAIRHLTRKKHQ
jgi:hypothetical protein